jgi:hypothetical protein
MANLSLMLSERRVAMKKNNKRLSKKDQGFAQRAVELAFEFNRYVIEHPGIAEKIGAKASIFFRIEGDEEFNTWSREHAAKQHLEDDQPVIWINIKKIRPIRSRIEKLELVTACETNSSGPLTNSEERAL